MKRRPTKRAVERLCARWLRQRMDGAMTMKTYCDKVVRLQTHLLHLQQGCRWCNPRPWHR